MTQQPNVRRRRALSGLAVLLALALVAGALVTPTAAAGASAYDLSLLELCLSFIQTYFPGEYSLPHLLESAAKGLVQGLGDPYSDYLTAPEYNSLITGLSGAFGGLGIYIDLGADGYTVIIAPIKGTPADLAGLRAGDKIATIDGEDVRNWELNAVSNRLRGDPGTKVTVGIIRAGAAGLLTIELTRAWIEINPVEYELLADGIGYIHLASFSDNATAKIDLAIADLKAQGARGLVLDLRNNGGGYLDESITIADRFLTGGQTVLSIKRKTGEPEVRLATGAKYVGLPVVVLVNQGTASASEILAGAIQDNSMGEIVGVTTYGKGAIQNVWRFASGAGLRLTTAGYYTPSGRALQGLGINPDVVVADEALEAVLPSLAWYRPIRHMRVGLDVLELENVLKFLDLLPDVADGVYGLSSVEAVRAFQRSEQLIVTGVVNEITAQRLNEAVTEHLSATVGDAQLKAALAVLKGKL